MDPLSIAAGSASLTALCLKISALLYGFLDDAQNVDGNLSGLNEEVVSLSRALEAINKSWKQDPLIASAQTGRDSDLWYSVRASMGDCKNTLEQLHGKLDDVQKRSFIGRGFLRKPVKQIKLNMKSKDISTYQQRIHSYSLAMHGALQAINVCLLLRGNSSQEVIVKVLDGLQAQITRVEDSLQTQASAQLSTADILRGDETVINNLHRVAQAAASFHSNASSIMGARPTVWGGSVIGEPLSQEAFINIQNWIPPPVDEADRFGDSSSGPKSPSADSFSNMKSIPSYDPAILPVTETLNLDYESDIDQDLVKDFERLATASLQRNDYRKAEVFLGKILSRAAARDEEASLRLNLQIAYLRGIQGKFLDMIFSLESLLESQPNTLEKAHTYHTLALAYLQDADLEKSAIACKAAIRCKRRLIGKVASSSYESVALLAHIWDVCEDPEEAEGCRSLLPPGYIYTGILEPVKYMSENLDCLKRLVESSKKPLTFAISMGVTHTVVAWCYGQELGEAAEVNLWTHWPNLYPVKWSDAKIPSVLYYSADQNVVGWGPDIDSALKSTGYPKPEWHRCDCYQLRLSGAKDIGLDIDFPSLPSGKTVIDLLTDFLKKLFGVIDLSKIDAPDNIGHMHYVLITPEWLDDAGFRDFRSALALAGVPKILSEAGITLRSRDAPPDIAEHVSFVDEGQALIMSCVDELRRDMNVQVGGVILSVKCGGALVQLITYEIRNLVPFNLAAYTTITANTCGSCAVNLNFSRVVRSKIAKMELPDGSAMPRRVYSKSMVDFENRIKAEFKNDGRLWKIDLGLSKTANFPNADIKEGCFHFTNEEVLYLFTPVVDACVKLVNDQIKACARKNPRKSITGIVVGGAFARNEYLFGEIKSHVPLELRDHVIRPMEPESAIVRGALRTQQQRKIFNHEVCNVK